MQVGVAAALSELAEGTAGQAENTRITELLEGNAVLLADALASIEVQAGAPVRGNARRAVRGYVPTPRHPQPYAPRPLSTYPSRCIPPLRYLPPLCLSWDPRGRYLVRCRTSPKGQGFFFA